MALRRIPIAVVAVAVLATACGTWPDEFASGGNSNWVSGSTRSLAYDDNDYFTKGATCDGSFGGCVTEWTVKFTPSHNTGPIDEPVALKYVGKNDGAGLQFIFVFNWRTWSWYPVDAFRVVATSEVTVKKTLPGPGTDWLLYRGRAGQLGFVRVATIGNLNSTSADVLNGCLYSC